MRLLATLSNAWASWGSIRVARGFREARPGLNVRLLEMARRRRLEREQWGADQ